MKMRETIKRIYARRADECPKDPERESVSEFEYSGMVTDGLVGEDACASEKGYVICMRKEDVEIVKTYFPRSGGVVIFEVGPKGWHVTAPGRSLGSNKHQSTVDNFRDAVSEYLEAFPVEDTREFPLNYVFEGRADDDGINDIAAEAHQECGDLYGMHGKAVGLVSPFDSCMETRSERNDVSAKEMKSGTDIPVHRKYDVPFAFCRVPSDKRAYAAIANMTDDGKTIDGILYENDSLCRALDRFSEDINAGLVFGEFLPGDECLKTDVTLDMSKVTHRVVRAFWNGISLFVNIEFIRTRDNGKEIDEILRRIGNPEEGALYLSMRMDGKRSDEGIVAKRIVAVDIIDRKLTEGSDLLGGEIVDVNFGADDGIPCEMTGMVENK